MNNYKQFNITSSPFNIDLISGLLWDLEILGINEFDNYLSVYVQEDSELTIEKIYDKLNSLVKQNFIENINVEQKSLDNKNWNEEWEKKINVIEVTDRIVIKPSFRNYEKKAGQIILEIDPKMSFGTGEHQTTKLVLMMLEKYILKNQKVLDLGSGTAVLSIAASKLGAGEVVAVDNDEWCFINGKENIERNKINNIKLLNGTIDDVKENDFDLVMANINKNVLIKAKEKLYNKTSPNGLLILSGLLSNDKEEIKRQFTQLGLTAIEYQSLDEWITFVFKKA